MHDLYLNKYQYLINNNELFFSSSNDINNFNIKNLYTNYAFNSVIIPQDNLIYGTKRLLEVIID
jgi:hypothetical protein